MDIAARLNLNRRRFLQSSAAAGLAGGMVQVAEPDPARAFAYEPYPTDDELETVVTSCAHNCGSRHMLVAHKKGGRNRPPVDRSRRL